MDANLQKLVKDLDAETYHLENTYYDSAGDVLKRFLDVLEIDPLKSVLDNSLPVIDFNSWSDNQNERLKGSGLTFTFHWPSKLEERIAMQIAYLRSKDPQEAINYYLLTGFHDIDINLRYQKFLQVFFRPFIFDLKRVIERVIVEDMVPVTNASVNSTSQVDPRKIFVVHGRNKVANKAMFQFLRSIGLHPLEWTEAVKEAPGASPYIGDILDSAFKAAKAVVVLFTGDDDAHLREEFQSKDDPDYEKEFTPQPRPNVLFEAGLAFGVHPDRVVLVEIGKIRPFSDIGGRQYDSSNKRY